MPSLFSKALTTSQDDDELNTMVLPKGAIRAKAAGGVVGKAQPHTEEKKKGFESQAARLLHSGPAIESSTISEQPKGQEANADKDDSDTIQPSEPKAQVVPSAPPTRTTETVDPAPGEKRLFRKTAASEVESGEERRAKRARLLEKSGKDASELQKFIQRLRPNNTPGSTTE